jgi:ribosomal protein S18 acetylase RimI-like enzyme
MGQNLFNRPYLSQHHCESKDTETRLVEAVEAEAINRGCGQIVVRTHDFQAPQFYTKLGFAVIGRIPDYPVGHQEITMIKLLTKPKVLT